MITFFGTCSFSLKFPYNYSYGIVNRFYGYDFFGSDFWGKIISLKSKNEDFQLFL